jgi:hypothetical protein
MSRTAIGLTLAASCAFLQPAMAAGKVEVSFVEPARFTDAGRSAVDRERTLQSLSEVLHSLGGALPDGQVLRLEILDVDLAGEIEPLRWSWNDLRVLRGGVDSPHMTVRYTLLADGRTLKAGQAQLSDMNYLFAARGYALRQSGALPYETRMLKQWFDENFAAPH